jgi:hypothetical protein
MTMTRGLLDYPQLETGFAGKDATAGLAGVLAAVRTGTNHQDLFRMLLLQKRHELGLPLINPGDLRGADPATRGIYEKYVESVCREIGGLYLEQKNLPQAWRYFRTIADHEPVRQALRGLDVAQVTDEILAIALGEGLDRRWGFEHALRMRGLCHAINLFERNFSSDASDRQFAAALLARRLYRDLVNGVRRQIMERFGELPPETDLVDLILHRPWLFENGRTHADPQHIAAVSRGGLLSAGREDLIMALSISEYGRMLSPGHQQPALQPFEAGHQDCARYARALLGQDEENTARYFRSKLASYPPPDVTPWAAEMVVLLHWRLGKKKDALNIWQHYLNEQSPEQPRLCLPSFYSLCAEAGDFARLADAARAQNDISAWTAAKIMAAGGGASDTAPGPG